MLKYSLFDIVHVNKCIVNLIKVRQIWFRVKLKWPVSETDGVIRRKKFKLLPLNYSQCPNKLLNYNLVQSTPKVCHLVHFTP